MGNTVKGYGDINSRIVLLGEAVATEEIKLGRPFVGKSGKELDHYCLPAARISREDCYIDNVFQWMIPLDPRKKQAYLDKHLAKQTRDCLHRLQELKEVKVLVCLGATACSVMGLNDDMQDIHGIPHQCDVEGFEDIVIMPCYHPASGLRNPDNIGLIKYDFEQLGKLLWDECVVYPVDQQITQYNTWNSDFVRSTHDYEYPIYAIDAEWDVDGNTWCFTLSFISGEAWLIWPDELYYWKSALESALVILHNGFTQDGDLQRLHDCGIYPTRILDTMIMAAHLSLPQGLKTLSYRLLGIRQQHYSDVVKPVETKMALEYGRTIAAIEWPDPTPVPKWSNDPKKERVYEYIKTSCSKRKQDALRCNHCTTNNNNSSCIICNGSGFFYNRKVSAGTRVVLGTEHGHEYMSKGRNIGSLAKQALKRDGDNITLLNNWKKDGRLDMCQDVIGEWKGADLSHTDFADAMPYACQDADCTLQIVHKMAQMYKESGIPYPKEIDELC